MSNNNLKIELEQRKDKSQQTFLIGKLKGDFTLSFKDGVTFLIFTSDKGAEELQIAPMDNKKDLANMTQAEEQKFIDGLVSRGFTVKSPPDGWQ